MITISLKGMTIAATEDVVVEATGNSRCRGRIRVVAAAAAADLAAAREATPEVEAGPRPAAGPAAARSVVTPVRVTRDASRRPRRKWRPFRLRPEDRLRVLVARWAVSGTKVAETTTRIWCRLGASRIVDFTKFPLFSLFLN